MAQLREQAKKLEDEQKGMKKKVNERAIGVIEECAFSERLLILCSFSSRRVEKREKALTKMLSTVLKDKEKIEETIEELDRYKRDALQKTWEKVNG